MTDRLNLFGARLAEALAGARNDLPWPEAADAISAAAKRLGPNERLIAVTGMALALGPVERLKLGRALLQDSETEIAYLLQQVAA